MNFALFTETVGEADEIFIRLNEFVVSFYKIERDEKKRLELTVDFVMDRLIMSYKRL